MGARRCAQWSADTGVLVDSHTLLTPAQQSVEIRLWLETKIAMMATPLMATDAGTAQRRTDGSATTWSADRLLASKCVATTSKLTARNATTATLCRRMGAPTVAPLSAAIFAMTQSRKIVTQCAETGSFLLVRPAMIATWPVVMAAAASVLRRPDGLVPTLSVNRLHALRSVETA